MKAEDIAKIAGVSRSTVSRVVNNYPNVPEETRVKVMKVIKEHHYRPNAFARTLAGKKSETIGVFFIVDTQETGYDGRRIVHNDFFTAYLDAIVDEANKNSYYVLVQTIISEKDYERVEKAFVEKRIDGGILIGTRENTLNKLDIHSFEQPIVLFDYELSLLQEEKNTKNRLTILNTNDGDGINEAINYLVSEGHKDIGFIKGIENTLSAKIRFDAFINALGLQGIELKDEYILEGEFNQDIAYKAMESAIKEKRVASAYICANDYMAIAAMECLTAHGYKVPEDVSFIGIDNTRTGQLMSPKLTTLAPDFEAMAKTAVETILKRGQEKTVPEFVEFNIKLITRESVCKKV